MEEESRKEDGACSLRVRSKETPDLRHGITLLFLYHKGYKKISVNNSSCLIQLAKTNRLYYQHLSYVYHIKLFTTTRRSFTGLLYLIACFKEPETPIPLGRV